MKPNDLVCSCGKHRGVGQWSPEKRAAVYARQRQNLREFTMPHMWDFLKSWEAAHGPARFELFDGSAELLPNEVKKREPTGEQWYQR